MEFKEAMLYGGAISVYIPKSFDDLSKIRDVPDYQEVFVDENSECSMIIELLDEATECKTHLAEHYFNDISRCNCSKLTKVMTSDSLVELSNGFSFSKCFGTQLLEKKYNDIQEKEELFLYVLAVRISSKKTDIVISFNNPSKINHKNNNKRKYCQTQIEEILNKALKTLKIIDYNLFV
ncbi:hypothetical protein FG386_001140 [Cryptosporidium ryanae]|uniref:uncharacterized protein n=1 Tax=Cryptosporidium ryanae TaxID=515981 RepID=UPI00351A9263|nr:hypothetical protein FG386_001140 [Cryptosporidium ryanae]